MIIKTHNMSLSIDKINILNDININIEENSLNILIGENGSGKSMLLKTLSGFYKNYDGSVLLKEMEIKKIKDSTRAKIISYVSSDFNSTFPYSIYNIVEMGRYVVQSENQAITNIDREIIETCMKDLDVWSLKDKSIQEISTGEKMRTFIARAFVTESDVILLDEPTAPLDIRHKTMLFSIIQKLISNGKTIIISMHDLNDAINLKSNTIVLSKGRIIASGASDIIINEKLIKNAYGVNSKKSNAFTFY